VRIGSSVTSLVFLQTAPRAWTTLALTTSTARSASFEMTGAGPFSRHWRYGHDGRLQAASRRIDIAESYRDAFEIGPGAIVGERAGIGGGHRREEK